jgi:hypothetical protein
MAGGFSLEPNELLNSTVVAESPELRPGTVGEALVTGSSSSQKI